ncbi:MAG TPA: CsbD family protein [Terriglobales bacterium]|nr:CsbD family protein [Terriglobales bacterium]
MNWDQVQGQWKQMKGKAKAKWGKLTDDDLNLIEGHKDQLVGRIQERYGIAKDEAERQVQDWHDSHAAENEAERERLKRAG